MRERLGSALSLDKFATAKVSKYDKRKVIEKQRALKAKQFNKYKKLKKRLEASGGPLDYIPYDPSQEDMSGQHRSESEGRVPQQQQQQDHQAHQQQALAIQIRHKHHHQQQQSKAQDPRQQQQHGNDRDIGIQDKKSVKKHKQQKPASQLQRLADKAAADKAAKEQERQQRDQALAARQRHVEQKKKQRSHQKHDFLRKTKRGQPVMKYRVDKVLSVLEQEKGKHS